LFEKTILLLHHLLSLFYTSHPGNFLFVNFQYLSVSTNSFSVLVRKSQMKLKICSELCSVTEHNFLQNVKIHIFLQP
jgi:hypothetical protein